MIIAVSLIKIKIIIRVVIIYTTKPIIELKINADTIKIHTSKITKSNSFAKGLISLTSNMQIRYHSRNKCTYRKAFFTWSNFIK